ncbi:transposase [Streptomyces sp. NPDC058623]|uniref:transposase n=1 Tax=Streptomyces sp. NPDC058623 TaxID=3346563 RepID=UPI00365827E9
MYQGVLGPWVGSEGAGVTTWTAVLSELRNRGIEDVRIVVCDGLKGLPDGVTATEASTGR